MPARRGQSILEYTIIIGIVTVVLYYMGTGIKRGVQSLIKVTADQVGNQQNSDQDFNDTQEGFLVATNTYTQESRAKQSTELGSTSAYLANMVYDDASNTMTSTLTNGGFVQTSP